MKKFNYTYREENIEQTNVVIDATSVCPTDYIGDIRVTKVKIPRTSLPVAIAHVTPMGFTTEQRTAYDSSGWNALTDICYIVCQGKNTTWTNNGAQIQYFSDRKVRMDGRTSNGTRVWGASTLYNFTFMAFCMWEKPKWFQEEDGLWYMRNQDKPIYQWQGNSMGLQTRILHYGPNGLSPTLLNNYEQIQFLIRGLTPIAQIPNSSFITSPILGLNERLSSMFGVAGLPWQVQLSFDSTEDFGFGTNAVWIVPFLNNQHFICPTADTTYDSPALSYVVGGEIPSTQTDIIHNCKLTLNSYTPSEEIFPVNHIAIQCLDLNFEGESLSVNTKDLMGVVNPSDMYFLKTFLMSHGGKMTDFLYVNDLETETPVAVNSPRISSLKFSFFWIDKEHFIHPLEALQNTTIELQLVYTPKDYVAHKVPRLMS